MTCATSTARGPLSAETAAAGTGAGFGAASAWGAAAAWAAGWAWVAWAEGVTATGGRALRFAICDELAADLLGQRLQADVVERRVEPRRQRQRDVGLALVALPEIDAEIVVERVGVALAGIERQALEREEPGGIVRHRDEGGKLVPRPLPVDVARRADRQEDGALADAVEDLVERMVALEAAGVEIDVDLVAAAEPLLQRDAEILLELMDPRVTERVHLVVGVGVADEHIVFETMHEGHGQVRFRSSPAGF